MKQLIVAVLLFSHFVFKPLYAQDKQGLAASRLIARVLPKYAHQFTIVKNKNWRSEKAKIYSKNKRICIEGSTTAAIAYAFNYYLRKVCNASISWTGQQLNLPKVLPLPKESVVLNNVFKKRFMYNYCTFSYTMAFWDWKRWEQELDELAMHGINQALALVGQEAVWQNTLRRFNFSDNEIRNFISGPAYTPWWLMGNLEGWGGPVSQHWIDHQKQLQQKIVARMRELGITPILQGFYSMVPDALRGKFPESKIIESGPWLNFRRPATLLPPDSLYFKMATAYYEEQAKLYGSTNYYIGDLFHEGTTPRNVDLTKVAQGVYKAMTDFNPKAIWVMQAWTVNPQKEVLNAVPDNKALVIDLMSEAAAQYGGDPYSKEVRKEGFGKHRFIFSILPNFGGRTGFSAQLDSVAVKINRLKTSQFLPYCDGLGASPEAILQDPVFYDFLFDQAWSNGTAIQLDQWLKAYITSRYGKYDESIMQAWNILRNTVYRSQYNRVKSPPYESIITARPGWGKNRTSTWGYGELDYSPKELVKALELMLNKGADFKNVDTYLYDLVNITRQVIDDYGHVLYEKLENSYKKQDNVTFESAKQEFMEAILDLDQLMGTRKEFLLGNWIKMAKKASPLPQDQVLNEYNARALITTWTHELGDVNDYAYREYNGLLRDYYYQRWKLFFERIEKNRIDVPSKKDFFEIERAFTKDTKVYLATPQSDSWQVVQMLYQKYKNK